MVTINLYDAGTNNNNMATMDSVEASRDSFRGPILQKMTRRPSDSSSTMSPTDSMSSVSSGGDSLSIKSIYKGGFGAISQDEGDSDDVQLDGVSRILLEDIHKDTTQQVLKALAGFSEICGQSSEVRVQACRMGAPAAIVTLMKKWSVEKSVQAACFRVLIALTVGDENIQVRKALWMVGGMQDILNSMLKFPDSRSVQFFGCYAVLSLLPSGSEEGNVQLQKWMGRKFLRDYKGAKTIIRAMVQFQQDIVVQVAGCSVLLKLATFMHDGDDRRILLESGAISAFSVALESHPKDENIQHYTTLFMQFMAGEM